MTYPGKFGRMPLLLALCLLVGGTMIGCAASPKTVVCVDKSINIYDACDVTFDYEANSEVDTDSKLEGTVSPKTDVKGLPGL